MKYEKLPSPHHVLRQITPSRLRKDGDGNIVGILGEAFEKIEPDGLSVTWVEYWDGEEFDRGFKAREATEKERPMKKGGYACGNVAAIIEAGKLHKKDLSVKHDPTDLNEGHTLVKVPEHDPELFDRLAREVFTLDPNLIRSKT